MGARCWIEIGICLSMPAVLWSPGVLWRAPSKARLLPITHTVKINGGFAFFTSKSQSPTESFIWRMIECAMEPPFLSALAIAVLNSSIAFGGQWLDILDLPESLWAILDGYSQRDATWTFRPHQMTKQILPWNDLWVSYSIEESRWN